MKFIFKVLDSTDKLEKLISVEAENEAFARLRLEPKHTVKQVFHN